MSMISPGVELKEPVLAKSHQVLHPVIHTNTPAEEPAVMQAVRQAPVAEQQPLVMQNRSLEASYYYDQQLNQVIITLTREDTGEVVRQIPQEHVKRLLIGMMELAGKLFDVKA